MKTKNSSLGLITLKNAVLPAMQSLKEFAKMDLVNWIRRVYPELQFNPKSIDEIILKCRHDKSVMLLHPNVGNKRPAIYKWLGANVAN